MSVEVKQPEVIAESDRERRPVPVWLFVVVLLLIYWGMVYFDQHSGWFSRDVYAPYKSIEEVAYWQPSIGVDPVVEGRKVYNKPTCLACHMADGKGAPGQFPSLVKSEWVQEKEPGRLIRLVLNGLTGPLEFQGQTFNGSMVPWKDVLNDQEIAAVLTYIRKNKGWGNDAPEVTPERVAAVRAKVASRALPFTPAELMTISPEE